MARGIFPLAEAPCPALIVENGNALCSFVLTERANNLNPILAATLGIGCGCSMPDETTTDEEVEAFDLKSYALVCSSEWTSPAPSLSSPNT
jgi:hypothetical protein